METLSDLTTTQEHVLFICLRSGVMTPADNSNLEPSSKCDCRHLQRLTCHLRRPRNARLSCSSYLAHSRRPVCRAFANTCMFLSSLCGAGTSHTRLRTAVLPCRHTRPRRAGSSPLPRPALQRTNADMPHDMDYPYPIQILAFLSDTDLTKFMDKLFLTTLCLVCVTKLYCIME